MRTDRRETLRSVLDLLAIVLVVAGLAMWSQPVALVAAGLMTLWVSASLRPPPRRRDGGEP